MDLIFERPAMYLGHASVIKMEAFINGFGFALFEEKEKLGDPIYDGFAQWVIDRRVTRGQYPWSSVATMIGGSEAQAFGVARSFWNEYKKSLNSN